MLYVVWCVLCVVCCVGGVLSCRPPSSFQQGPLNSLRFSNPTSFARAAFFQEHLGCSFFSNKEGIPHMSNIFPISWNSLNSASFPCQKHFPECRQSSSTQQGFLNPHRFSQHSRPSWISHFPRAAKFLKSPRLPKSAKPLNSHIFPISAKLLNFTIFFTAAAKPPINSLRFANPASFFPEQPFSKIC